MISQSKKGTFYNKVRNNFFNGKLSAGHVDGMEAILNEWNRRDLCDLRRLAYMLATTYHETAKTMQPIREYGLGKGRAYGKPERNGKVYYGRGFVQLTWGYNYKKMSDLLGIDLYGNPDLALDADIATQILFEGMLTATSAKGDFTGKCLEQYFNDTKEDWVQARRIINGMDQAERIANYGKMFLAALH